VQPGPVCDGAEMLNTSTIADMACDGGRVLAIRAAFSLFEVSFEIFCPGLQDLGGFCVLCAQEAAQAQKQRINLETSEEPILQLSYILTMYFSHEQLIGCATASAIRF
jgi:hypothetical protein